MKRRQLLLSSLASLVMITGCASQSPAVWTGSDGVRLSNDSSDFVLLSDAVPDAILEIRYYSTYNFVSDRIDGYEEPVALLTRQAAAALRAVSDELVTKGYRLKIFDSPRRSKPLNSFRGRMRRRAFLR